jgi:hypothetical protein
MEPNFTDEIDCENFFDQMDDLIEFPSDIECGDGNLVGAGDCKDLTDIWTDAFPDCDPLFSGSHVNSASDLSAELSVPYEDIVQLEWPSTFGEDSFSGGGMTIGKEDLHVNKEPSSCNQFQTSSPVSELDSSTSSCSGGKTMPLSPPHHGPQRARSKRPRPATFNPQGAIQRISPSSSTTETPRQAFIAASLSSESDNFVESPPMKKIQKLAEEEQQKKEKKKIKITFRADPTSLHHNPPVQMVRKCLHCEITKTPQWRAGPMGPKTLCNACGVRYKSGRLFPEYRPAASPTLVPSLHSNSHKKVLEMRSKAEPGTAATMPTTLPELLPIPLV